ncbi:MAG: hypothetical protein CMJ78_18060 [Planctomycetaceae bacterium]|nr:hypothetical protein [Planctomycetaceae bacterium]
MYRCFPYVGVFALCFLSLACNSESDTEQTVQNDFATDDNQVDPPVLPASDKESKAPDGQVEPGDKSEKAEEIDMKTYLTSDRKTIVGNWILVISGSSQTEDFIDISAFVLDIRESKSEGEKYKVRKLFQAPVIGEAEVESYAVTDETVQVEFLDVDQMKLVFNGKFDNGVVFGNMSLGGAIRTAARLIPTDSDKISEENGFSPTPGRLDLGKALRSDDPVADLKTFCKENPDSPVTVDAYQELIMRMNTAGESADDIKPIIDDYIKTAGRWGKGMQQTATFYAGYFLARTRNNPKLSLELLDRVTKDFEFEPLEAQAQRIEMARKEAKTNNAIQLTQSEDEKTRDEGVATLNNMRSENPFNPEVIYALAEVSEKMGDVDAAMNFYSQLVILPQLAGFLDQIFQNAKVEKPSPSEALDRLWKEKHGDTEGLDEFNAKVYNENLYLLSKAKSRKGPTEDTGNRVVLAELFTGAGCPPCVAADVALGSVERELPESALVVLRYHLHTAGIDPLTNRDGEFRAYFYQTPGTPSLFINGKDVDTQSVAGYLPMAKNSYDSIHKVIDTAIKESTEINIQATAKAANGVVKAGAEIKGLDGIDGDIRLHAVIAEDRIDFAGRNGIRQHDMVVRSVITPDDGVALKEATHSFTEDIVLSEFRDSIIEYLTTYEEGQGVFFSVKPLELEKLHFVVFVQNMDSHEVLQAVSIPVSGELDYSAAPKPEAKPDSAKPEEKKPEEEKAEEKKPAEEKPAEEKKPAADASKDEKSANKEQPAAKPEEKKAADAPAKDAK